MEVFEAGDDDGFVRVDEADGGDQEREAVPPPAVEPFQLREESGGVEAGVGFAAGGVVLAIVVVVVVIVVVDDEVARTLRTPTISAVVRVEPSHRDPCARLPERVEEEKRPFVQGGLKCELSYIVRSAPQYLLICMKSRAWFHILHTVVVCAGDLS